MKNIIKSVLCGFTIFLLSYLIGAFGCADFNIINWDINVRFMVGVFGGIIGMLIMGLTLDILSNRKF